MWWKLGLVLALGAMGFAIINHYVTEARKAARCADQLRAIYRALEMYEMERGSLPQLAYYPDSPLEDPDSLRTVLEAYGLDPEYCVCPASRRIQRAEGLTYLWNVKLNGLRIPRGGQPVWMLVDMEALGGGVPAPHFGGYNVLFSDGSVRRLREPRRDLPGL